MCEQLHTTYYLVIWKTVKLHDSLNYLNISHDSLIVVLNVKEV
jgi:hypothetical protein